MKKIVIYAMGFLLFAGMVKAQDTIYIYGPGGPLGPMKECADTFSRQNNIAVKVVAGPENNWIGNALQNADLIFGGAEYMLDDFTQRHPGFIDPSGRVSLYTRSAGILVRPGNPRHIHSIKDLAKPGMRVMITTQAGQTAMWEELSIKDRSLADIQKNIFSMTGNSAQAINNWKNDSSIDAWITYASWHYRLKDITDLVAIPAKKNISRGTPIALTNRGRQKQAANQFIQFLLTDRGKEIFTKWGWDK